MKTMSSRERVQAVFQHEIPDRVPIDYQSNGIIEGRLMQHLGLHANEREILLQRLGIDFRMAWVNYTGPLLFDQRPNMNVDPMLGSYTRWVENESGGYNDCCFFPLKDVEPEIIAHYPVINPDDFNYGSAVEQIKSWENCAVFAGHAGICDIINTLGRLMGMEDALVNLMMEDEATLYLVDRLVDMQLKMLERLIVKSEHIDFLHTGEDLGTQNSPMISLELFRNVIRPRHQKFVDLAKAYDLPVMIHSCGSSSWAFDDFIEMGITAVDTLQPEAANMNPRYLKETYGRDLVFHGCISTAGPLAYGTPEETSAIVRQTLEIMMPHGGYCLAPTHMIQDNTPVENILAMYDTGKQYGRYN